MCHPAFSVIMGVFKKGVLAILTANNWNGKNENMFTKDQKKSLFV